MVVIHAKPRARAQHKPCTRFVNNINPFTGQDMTVKKKPASFVDISKLTIADDPLPTHRSAPGHKYDAVFDKLKPGKCLVCESGEAGKIGHALNTYLKRKGKPGTVRTAQRYEKDGKGRVWLLTDKA